MCVVGGNAEEVWAGKATNRTELDEDGRVLSCVQLLVQAGCETGGRNNAKQTAFMLAGGATH